VLSLPAFAVDALRDHQQLQHQRTPLRLLLVQPGQAPGRSSSTCYCAPGGARRFVPSMPARRSGPSPKLSGVRAHPHLLRHSLASAMAAAKEPASVIAGQLRHADGGTLASRTYIHQLPHTPPRLARLIEAMYGPAARQATSDDRNG
jgi:integrase